MSVLRIRFPVRTLDGRLLVPADAALTPELLEAVAASGKGRLGRPVSILSHGTVRADLRRFLHRRPYRVIFGGPETASDVWGLMEKVCVVPPVLTSLDFFRRRDPYTYRHTLTVFALATLLARDLVADRDDRIRGTVAGPLHDFGKVCVPIPILRKSSPLTRSERAGLEHHAAAGFVLLCHYLRDPGRMSARVARDHHERRDGSGYPQGARLADRLIEIIAACDIYDALISPRPYRPVSYDNRTAIEEMTAMAERGLLGMDIVQALAAVNRRDRPRYSEVVVSRERRGVPPEGNLYGVVVEDESPPPPRASGFR
jgi:HD-GYP domain-containing protein (c-di-GMP phosphodiesterase class II)